MRSDVTRHIERYLDAELGWWTRLLPWRRELVTHYEEAWSVAGSRDMFEPATWDAVVNDFGDVRDVATQLQRENGQLHFGLRLILLGAALFALIVAFGAQLGIIANVPSAVVVFVPAGVALAWQLARGAVRWPRVRAIACTFAVVLTAFGLSQIFVSVDDPSGAGAPMAGATLCMLYAVLAFAPGPVFHGLAIVTVLVEMILMAVLFNLKGSVTLDAFLQFDLLSASLVRGVAMVCVFSVFLALARFGPGQMTQRALHAGVVAFLLGYVVLLARIAEPGQILPTCAMALAAMAATASVCAGVGAGVRLLQRHKPLTQ